MKRTAASRLEKREHLIRAAADVLLTQGVAGCTVRAIAERSGLSKSAIHYYFEEADDLIELAWDRLMSQFIDRMAKAAAGAEDPVERLWAAAEAYVRLGTGHDRRIPMMAFDFLIFSRRRGDTRAAASVMDRITSLFAELLAATDSADAAVATPVFMSALIGTVVRAEISPVEPEVEFAAIADTMGLPRPRR